MSRTNFGGPKLPAALLDKVQDGGISKRRRDVPRKDRRKAEREAKKGGRRQPHGPQRVRRIDQAIAAHAQAQSDDGEDTPPPQPKAQAPKPPNPTQKDTKPPNPTQKDTKPPKSILKKAPPPPPPASESGDESEDEHLPAAPIVSRAVQSKLDDDDAEIAALERKLGMRGKKKKKIGDEELDWLVHGSDDDEDAGKAGKRKRPEDDDWLRSKRAKAGGGVTPVEEEIEDSDEDEDADDHLEDGLSDLAEGDGMEESDDAGDDGVENPFSDDEVDSDDFGDFGSDDEEEVPPPKRVRENPYVAPVSKSDAGAPAGKYIPPSLRKAAASDEEALKQLRRQLNGLLNRLSEANILSILQSIEEVYEKNARQHVTSTLIDLLVSLASDPSTLNETFLILHAGFATALYKVIGTDFGAQLLEQIVLAIDKSRTDAGEGKQTLNLIGFLSNLYTLQLTGSAIIFDYIRIFLESLSENNTELLLRMIRTSGPQLRLDDPTSLKDIVLLLQKSITALGGEANLSVRTKFMIETITNLKNNRVKTGVAASTVSAEHTTRMKRTLGALSARTVRATEPLRISLADIRDSDKKGKWWLVGASWRDPAKHTPSHSRPAVKEDDGYESSTPSSGPSISKLAKAQGMNTDIRRAIFTSLLSATDASDAYTRLLKLHLKNKQSLEIPRVLLHCAGAEEGYNPYYTFVARRVCTERRLRKAFQYQLWDVFRRMGETPEGDEGEEEGEGEVSVGTAVNLARLYGSLVASGNSSIAALRTLNLNYLQPRTQMFVEVLLTTVLLEAHRAAKAKSSSSAPVEFSAFETAVRDVFAQTSSSPALVAGLRYFLESTVEGAELANGKREKRIVREGCEFAVQALAEVAAGKLGSTASAGTGEAGGSDGE